MEFCCFSIDPSEVLQVDLDISPRHVHENDFASNVECVEHTENKVAALSLAREMLRPDPDGDAICQNASLYDLGHADIHQVLFLG